MIIKFKYNVVTKMQMWPPERDFQQKLAGFQLHNKTLAGILTTTLLTPVQERWTENANKDREEQ